MTGDATEDLVGYGIDDGFPSWLTGAYVLIVIGTVIAGLFASGRVIGSPDETEALLLALGTAQASIVALTFTITFLGVQLVANRYTLRTTDPFTSDPLFQVVFGLFVVSIALDFILALHIQTGAPTLTRVQAAMVVVASGLALASVVSLPGVMQRTLELSTPEGIAAELGGQVDTSEAVVSAATTGPSAGAADRATDGPAESGTVSSPLQNLHSLATSAMFGEERRAAWVASNRFVGETWELLEEIDAEDVDAGSEGIDQMLESVFREELAVIARNAYQGEERQLFKDTIAALRQLGEYSLGIDDCPGALHAMAGLDEILSEVPPESSSSHLYESVIREQLCLIRASIDTRRWDSAAEMIGVLHRRLMGLSADTRGDAVLGRLLSLSFRELRTMAVCLMLRDGASLDQPADFNRDPEPDNVIKHPQDQVLQQCLHLLREITMIAIESQIDHLDQEEIGDCWASICTRASMDADPSDAYITALLFEFCVLETIEDPRSEESGTADGKIWMRALSEVAYRRDWATVSSGLEICRDAIDRKRSHQEGQAIDRTTLEICKERVPLSPSRLVDRLDEIEGTVRSRYAKRVWEEHGAGEVRDEILRDPSSVSSEYTLEFDSPVSSRGILCRDGDDRLVLVQITEALSDDDTSDLDEHAQRFEDSPIGGTATDTAVVFLTPSVEGYDSTDEFEAELPDGVSIVHFDPSSHLRTKRPSLEQFTSETIEATESGFIEMK